MKEIEKKTMERDIDMASLINAMEDMEDDTDIIVWLKRNDKGDMNDG